MKKIITVLTSLLLIGLVSTGQVTSVNYKLVYNPATCLYDCKLVINAGTATTAAQRNTLSASFTIVLPTGTTLGAMVPNEPQDRTTLLPLTWTQPNTEVNNPSLAGFDARSFAAPLINSRYSNLTAGTEVLLFSIRINTTSCGSGIRMWDNAADPSPAAFSGRDFDNGFAVGTTAAQKYAGNTSANTIPSSPTVSVTGSCTAGNINFVSTPVAASPCASAFTYSWTGPNGFTSTSQNITLPYSASTAGSYTLVAKDANGCTVSKTQVDQCTALPVIFSSFTAKPVDCAAQLRWVTQTEINNNYYEVEWSTDGQHFNRIARVASQNNAGGASYSFLFSSMSTGANYFRIIAVDFDGARTATEVIRLNSACKNPVITIAPNPTKDVVNIYGLTGTSSIIIYDAAGRQMTSLTSKSASETINVINYARGTYVVRIINGDKVISTFKLVKE